MSPGNPARLLKLADREFSPLPGKPVAQVPGRKFKAMKINAARFTPAWHRKRGAVVRLTVVLADDDMALEQRVCSDERWPGVRRNFIRPGKPVENAYIESFNGRFRDECLNEHWFLTMNHDR